MTFCTIEVFVGMLKSISIQLKVTVQTEGGNNQ